MVKGLWSRGGRGRRWCYLVTKAMAFRVIVSGQDRCMSQGQGQGHGQGVVG